MLRPNQSLNLIPTVKRRDRLEPAVDDFAERGATNLVSLSINVRAPGNKQSVVRCRRLPVPPLLSGSSGTLACNIIQLP